MPSVVKASLALAMVHHGATMLEMRSDMEKAALRLFDKERATLLLQ